MPPRASFLWAASLLLSSITRAASDTPPSPESNLTGDDLPPIPPAIQGAPGVCPSHLKDVRFLRHPPPTACAVPLDNRSSSDPAHLHPWTHLPHCLAGTRSPSVRYCVYTNANFGTYGLSLVTQPHVASVALEVLDDPAEVTLPVVQRPVGEVFVPPYVITDVPGKGKGVLASRLIRPLETFMADHPSLVIDVEFPGSVKQLEGYEMLHRAADQLSDPPSVYSLGRSSKSGADVVEDVLRTNSFHSDLLGVGHMALFPEVSRMNHACKPNAFLRYSHNGFAVGVAAYREIQPGEEITISYLPLGLTHEERQKRIQRWGFACTCDTCTAGPDEIAQSDSNRRRVETLKGETVQQLQRGKPHAAIKATKEAIDLLAEEELVQQFADQYDTLARIYWAMKDKKKARVYAKMALGILRDYAFLEERDEEKDLEKLMQSLDVGV